MRIATRGMSMAVVRCAACCAFLWSAPLLAADETPAPVRVERIKPARTKLPTLTFLRTNLDFVRGRLDLLRERPAGEDAGARALDPRFLAYARLLAQAGAAGDSAAAVDRAVAGRELFAHVGELAALEAELDGIGRLLADQESRLAQLQADFSGRPATELGLLVTGLGDRQPPSAIVWVREDGDSVRVTWSDAERAALRSGATLEAFRGRIEPREQVLEIACEGPGYAGAPRAWITLDPRRDHLTWLRLDLSAVTPAEGAAASSASTWTLTRDTAMGAALRP